VHGNETISALLDIHVRKREKEAPARSYGWHPSEFVGMCARQNVLARLLGVMGKPFDTGLLKIFDVGTALHAWYQNQYFGEMGILWGKWQCLRCDTELWGTMPQGRDCAYCHKSARWVYQEVCVRAPLPGNFERGIVGHSDGLILLNGRWYLLEIKTINEGGFTWLKQPKPNHARQAQVYAELVRQGFVDFGTLGHVIDTPKIFGIVLLYVNKNKSLEKTFELEFDREYAQEQLRGPYDVEVALRDKIFPARCPECVNLLQKPAKDCPLASYCFGGKSWAQLERSSYG